MSKKLNISGELPINSSHNMQWSQTLSARSYTLIIMLNSLSSVTAELRIELVIGYGSSFTGKKRGMSERKDIDLVIVSDFFKSVSMSKRKEIVIEKLGKKIDLIPLTTQEYKKLRKNKDSLVNMALKEGRILYDAEKQSLGRARQQI